MSVVERLAVVSFAFVAGLVGVLIGYGLGSVLVTW